MTNYEKEFQEDVQNVQESLLQTLSTLEEELQKRYPILEYRHSRRVIEDNIGILQENMDFFRRDGLYMFLGMSKEALDRLFHSLYKAFLRLRDMECSLQLDFVHDLLWDYLREVENDAKRVIIDSMI